MNTKKLKKGYNQLTDGEKDATLIALLNFYDPVPAIKNEINEIKKELVRLKEKHGVNSEKVRKYEYRVIELNLLLNNALQKIDNSSTHSWLKIHTKLESIEDLVEEFYILTQNSLLSLRAKGIAAFLMIEIYQDTSLMYDGERQKQIVHQHSLLDNSTFKELKGTVTKALKELPNYEPNMSSTQEGKWLHLLTPRDKDYVIKGANTIYALLQDADFSWQAKGLYFYMMLYTFEEPIAVSILCPGSNIDWAISELQSAGIIKLD